MKDNRVLYISSNGYFGGAERFVYNALKGHHAKKHIYSEIFFFNDGNFVEICHKEKIPFHLLPFRFQFTSPLKLFKAILYLRKYALENHFNIIHATMSYAFIISYFACLFTGIKQVWFQHGPIGNIFDKIGNLLKPDSILFNTDYLRSVHLKMPFSQRYSHLHRIINCGTEAKSINFDKVNKIQEEYKKNKSLFLIAGRISPWKGYENVLQAVLPLDHEKYHLLIIGDYTLDKDRWYAESLKNFVKENSLEDTVTFIRYVNDLENYIKASDVFIHASTIPEPYGLVVSESMIQKTLVIGSDEGGVTSILINNETGLSFPSTRSGCSEQLSKLLLKVINKDQNFDEIIDKAYNKISKEYSIEQMINSLEDEYQKLLKDKNE